MATSNLPVFTNSTTASAVDIENFKAAIVGDFVPMDASGTFTNDAFNLGTSTVYWAKSYVMDYVAGTSFTNGTQAGITASTTQTQGQQPLTKDINEISIVANTDDVVTLPVAVAGRRVTIINNGANRLQIFPASGDNLGKGVDVSIKLKNGNQITFTAYETTNWEFITNDELINIKLIEIALPTISSGGGTTTQDFLFDSNIENFTYQVNVSGEFGAASNAIGRGFGGGAKIFNTTFYGAATPGVIFSTGTGAGNLALTIGAAGGTNGKIRFTFTNNDGSNTFDIGVAVFRFTLAGALNLA